MDPKIIVFSTSFGVILGAILGPELAPKGDQKWDHFWNPQRRISGVGQLRFCELNRSGGIAMATGIIFDKRKGGIDTNSQISFLQFQETLKSHGKGLQKLV